MLDMQKLEEEAEDDLDKRYGKYRSQNASALKSRTDFKMNTPQLAAVGMVKKST